MEQKHYYIALRDDQRDEIVRALREHPGVPKGLVRCDLANQLERTRGEDDILSLATSRLRAWYYGRVQDLAACVLSEILSGRIGSTDALRDYLSETVDGTDIVIYTFKARAALLASDNADAMTDETGEAGTAEQQAYFALLADVREALQAEVSYRSPGEAALPEGFDLDASDTWKPGAPCIAEGCTGTVELGSGTDYCESCCKADGEATP